MTDFTLRQLEAFVAVVEERSVTGAAERLRLSPGAVSVALSELERMLKVQLTVRRRGQGVTITHAGMAAYERARRTLAEARALHELNRTLQGELAGPLRVGCFTTLSPWLLPSIAQFFAAHHPAVDVSFSETSTDALLEGMRSDGLDAALMYASHLPAGFASHPIAEVRLQVALAADHPLAARDQVPLSALEGEPAILLGIEPSLSHVEQLVREAGHSPRVRWRSANPETIRSMVARGLGYTIIMGRPYGDRSIEGMPLAYRRISDDVPASTVVVAHLAARQPDERVLALREFCAERFGGQGDPLTA